MGEINIYLFKLKTFMSHVRILLFLSPLNYSSIRLFLGYWLFFNYLFKVMVLCNWF